VWHECLSVGWRRNVPWEEVLGKVERKDFSGVDEPTVKQALINQLENDRWWENTIKNDNLLWEDHSISLSE
jgi:translation elongation factor EF-Tu-like GTPase